MSDWNKNWTCYSTNATNGQALYEVPTFTCSPGFYCPNTVSSDVNSSPVYCPPSIDCIMEKLGGIQCKNVILIMLILGKCC